jgi:hypothetical protein
VQSLRTGAAAAAVEFAQRRRKRSLKIESASLAALRACSTLCATPPPMLSNHLLHFGGSSMASHPETDRARIVLDHGRSSVNSFFATFDHLLKIRKAKTGGAPTDEEQDLLRSALVFAAAALDSSLKQLVRGALPKLAERNESVAAEFETFVQRQLKGETDDVESSFGHKFLASILVSRAPQDKLLSEYVIHLTGTSLQSVEQLFKTCRALDVSAKSLASNRKLFQDIFEARNKITHELDVRFTGKQGHRQRNSRRRDDMQKYSEALLDVAEEIVSGVEAKLV